MANYYFDIETVPLESYRYVQDAGLDTTMAKIISVQYQKLSQDTGAPIGDLNILKEWEDGSSEELIIKRFKPVFVTDYVWDFVPIGNNLAFDFKFLKAKFNKYFGEESRRFGHRPFVDVKHTLVIMNKGQFKGYDALLGKSHEAKYVTDWYYSKEYSKIEDYIRREASSFVEKYQILLKLLPTLRPTVSLSSK